MFAENQPLATSASWLRGFRPNPMAWWLLWVGKAQKTLSGDRPAILLKAAPAHPGRSLHRPTPLPHHGEEIAVAHLIHNVDCGTVAGRAGGGLAGGVGPPEPRQASLGLPGSGSSIQGSKGAPRLEPPAASHRAWRLQGLQRCCCAWLGPPLRQTGLQELPWLVPHHLRARAAGGVEVGCTCSSQLQRLRPCMRHAAPEQYAPLVAVSKAHECVLCSQCSRNVHQQHRRRWCAWWGPVANGARRCDWSQVSTRLPTWKPWQTAYMRCWSAVDASE